MSEKLTRLERLFLINQFKILEALYPSDIDYYENNRKALEEGFELHYDDCFSVLSEDILTEDDCKEVLDILNMYRAITFSYKDYYNIEDSNLTFRGFDLNDKDEYKKADYARYFINDLDRFDELKNGHKYIDCNSHYPMMNKYRRMLEVWKNKDEKFELTKEDIENILSA